MRKLFVILCALALLAGCTKTETNVYEQISQEDAARLMEEETDCVILDVRRPDEYAEGHIPGAYNLPNENITSDDTPVPELPDKDQLILVYCRSGNRSRQAAQKLADKGYTNVKEFGGITDWKGPIVMECYDEAIQPVLMLDRAETGEKDGITLQVTGYDRTERKLDAVLTNTTDETVWYGEPFDLLYRQADTYEQVEGMADMTWITIALELPAGESRQITCDISGLELTSGDYILVKEGVEAPFTLVYSE